MIKVKELVTSEEIELSTHERTGEFMVSTLDSTGHYSKSKLADPSIPVDDVNKMWLWTRGFSNG